MISVPSTFAISSQRCNSLSFARRADGYNRPSQSLNGPRATIVRESESHRARIRRAAQSWFIAEAEPPGREDAK